MHLCFSSLSTVLSSIMVLHSEYLFSRYLLPHLVSSATISVLISFLPRPPFFMPALTAVAKHLKHSEVLAASPSLSRSQWALVSSFINIAFFPPFFPYFFPFLGLLPFDFPPRTFISFLTYVMPYFHDSITHIVASVSFSSTSSFLGVPARHSSLFILSRVLSKQSRTSMPFSLSSQLWKASIWLVQFPFSAGRCWATHSLAFDRLPLIPLKQSRQSLIAFSLIPSVPSSFFQFSARHLIMVLGSSFSSFSFFDPLGCLFLCGIELTSPTNRTTTSKFMALKF